MSNQNDRLSDLLSPQSAPSRFALHWVKNIVSHCSCFSP